MHPGQSDRTCFAREFALGSSFLLFATMITIRRATTSPNSSAFFEGISAPNTLHGKFALIQFRTRLWASAALYKNSSIVRNIHSDFTSDDIRGLTTGLDDKRQISDLQVSELQVSLRSCICHGNGNLYQEWEPKVEGAGRYNNILEFLITFHFDRHLPLLSPNFDAWVPRLETHSIMRRLPR